MPPALTELIDRFTDAFNRNDLDAVMAAFADDCEYRPGNGKVHRGRAAIRAAFAPQFSGAFGAMRFDPEDRLIDETARKAALRWICRHDMSGAHGKRVSRLLKLAVRARHGARVSWHGVDEPGSAGRGSAAEWQRGVDEPGSAGRGSAAEWQRGVDEPGSAGRGSAAEWQRGVVDVFHFDASGKITGKYTYASYDRPLLSRELGVAL